MEFDNFFDEKLQELVDDGRYRYFITLLRKAGEFPRAQLYDDTEKKGEVKIWCSNDYLCLGQHVEVIKAANDANLENGVGAGGTRNISGTNYYHVLLEKRLAEFHKKQSALIFTSGYVANITALSTLARNIPNVIFYSDAGNHNSMIEGLRLGHATKRIFRHNDIAHLQELIKADPKDAPKIIVAESVYSMHGTMCKLADIVTVAKENKAMIYLDEVHAVGLYGKQGGGIAQQENLEHEIDIIQGTMAKAFGTIGGYIAGNCNLVDFIRSYGYGFIFTSSLPPGICAASLKSLELIKNGEILRAKLHKTAALLKQELINAELPLGNSATHIVPVKIGDSHLCRAISDELLYKHKIYVQPINYPTVKKGEERLRFTPNPQHCEQDIAELIEILCNIFSQRKIISKAL